MKQVLVLSFYFPPRQEVGAVRPRGLAKYLPEFGWKTVVLTPKLPAGDRLPVETIETDYRDVVQEWKARFGLDSRGLHQQLNLPPPSKGDVPLLHTRIIDGVKALITFPDPTKGWQRFALQAVSELAKKRTIDAIISTSPPETSHLIACKAKKLLRCPWIADFRDLWIGDPLRTRKFGGWMRPMYVRVERNTLRTADGFVAASAPMRAQLSDRYPEVPAYCITNGFDPEEMSTTPTPLTDFFSITYTGELYQGRRDPTPVLQALSELIREGFMSRKDVRLRFYGPSEHWLQARVNAFELTDVVEIHGRISREQSLRRQRESQVLLLINWHDASEPGMYTGKIFDYFNAGRPVLAVGGGHCVITDLLEQTKAGVHGLSLPQIRNFLIHAYSDFQRNRHVRYSGDASVISRYSHREMAARFASLLDDLVGVQSDNARLARGAWSGLESR
jgi:hypothetical protein